MNKVRRHILDPVAAEKGYKTNRADEIPRPGVITNQIIEHLMKDDLVIADLTDLNPNVLYELAVRHAVNKPVILIGQIDSKDIPFDLSAQRFIQYSLDPDDINNAKIELSRQIDSVELKDFVIDSPIKKEIVFEEKESKPMEFLLSEIYSIVRNQTMALRDLQSHLYLLAERNIRAHKSSLDPINLIEVPRVVVREVDIEKEEKETRRN